YRIALGQQNQQQSGRPQPQTKPLQATETLQDGGVVLRHGEGKRLTETAEGGAVNQQALSLRPITELRLQTLPVWQRQIAIPQRARAPGLVGEIDTEIVPGKRPLIHRIKALLIQLNAILATHQCSQQALRSILEILTQIASQAVIEQPEAALGQNQPHDDQYTSQAQAKPALDRLQAPTPA